MAILGRVIQVFGFITILLGSLWAFALVGPQIRNYAAIGVAYIPPHTGFHPKFFKSIDAR